MRVKLKVRRLSGGSEMDGLEAIETINSWRRILIEGNPDQIDRMLADVERRLDEKGWTREPRIEAKMEPAPNQANRWRCFVGGPRNGPKLMLGLTRVSDRRVRGGTYSLIDGPPGMRTTDVAGVVGDVMNEVVTPSASSFGLKVTIPRLGRLSRVPPKTAAALLTFSDSVAGIWPLPPESERMWRHFVIDACREDAAFDVDEISDWFVTNGWASEAAHALTKRFISEAGLITEYEEESKS
jgi:hypothetical protein